MVAVLIAMYWMQYRRYVHFSNEPKNGSFSDADSDFAFKGDVSGEKSMDFVRFVGLVSGEL